MDIKAELETELKRCLAQINSEPEEELESQEISNPYDVEVTDAEWEEALRHIKEEPVEKPTVDLMQQVVVVIKSEVVPMSSDSESDDEEIECDQCSKTFQENSEYKKHLKKYHSLTTPNLQPDIDDPDDYCKVCKKKYRSRKFYLRHLRDKHKMALDSIYTPARPYVSKRKRKTAEPEPQFQATMSYFCTLCQKSIVNKRRFLGHIRRVHNIISEGMEAEMDDTNSAEESVRCTTCTLEISDSTTSDEHNETAHPPKKIKANYMYDTTELLMKCRFCGIQGLNQDSYREHLTEMHDDRLKPLLSKIVQPYAHDKKPEVFCTTCEIKMDTLGDCLTHLRKSHDLKVYPDPTSIINQAVARFKESGMSIHPGLSNNDAESFTSIVQYLMKSGD